MLKYYFILFTSAILTVNCFAQETIEKRNRLTDDVTEYFTLLKSNYTKQGIYKAIYKRKTAVATGMYDKDQKTGLWRFYNPQGKVLETYDYTNKKIYYEAPEDTSSSLRYFVDKQLDTTSKVTKPVKTGGRYYGYLPYLSLFTVPKYLRNIDYNAFSAVVELLITPYGRLAEYKVRLTTLNFEKTINMNINLPNEEDKVFSPATLNGEPISSRVLIRCYVTNSGHLDFEQP